MRSTRNATRKTLELLAKDAKRVEEKIRGKRHTTTFSMGTVDEHTFLVIDDDDNNASQIQSSRDSRKYTRGLSDASGFDFGRTMSDQSAYSMAMDDDELEEQRQGKTSGLLEGARRLVNVQLPGKSLRGFPQTHLDESARFVTEAEEAFVQDILSSKSLQLRSSNAVRDFQEVVFSTKAKMDGVAFMDLLSRRMHVLKVDSVRACWTQVVSPLQEKEEQLRSKYDFLQKQFSEARANLLKEVSDLRDCVRTRGDPDSMAELQPDVVFHLEPTDLLSPEERTFCLAVVKEKLKMLFETGKAQGVCDVGQLESLIAKAENHEVNQLRKALDRKTQQVAELKHATDDLWSRSSNAKRSGASDDYIKATELQVEGLNAELEAEKCAVMKTKQLVSQLQQTLTQTQGKLDRCDRQRQEAHDQLDGLNQVIEAQKAQVQERGRQEAELRKSMEHAQIEQAAAEISKAAAEAKALFLEEQLQLATAEGERLRDQLQEAAAKAEAARRKRRFDQANDLVDDDIHMDCRARTLSSVSDRCCEGDTAQHKNMEARNQELQEDNERLSEEICTLREELRCPDFLFQSRLEGSMRHAEQLAESSQLLGCPIPEAQSPSSIPLRARSSLGSASMSLRTHSSPRERVWLRQDEASPKSDERARAISKDEEIELIDREIQEISSELIWAETHLQTVLAEHLLAESVPDGTKSSALTPQGSASTSSPSAFVGRSNGRTISLESLKTSKTGKDSSQFDSNSSAAQSPMSLEPSQPLLYIDLEFEEPDEARPLRQTVSMLARKKRSLMTRKLLWRYQGSLNVPGAGVGSMSLAASGAVHDQAINGPSCANCAVLKTEVASLKELLGKLQGLGGEMAQHMLSTAADNLGLGDIVHKVAQDIKDAQKQMEGTKCPKARNAMTKLKAMSVFERLFAQGPRHRKPSYVEQMREKTRLSTQHTFVLDKHAVEMIDGGQPLEEVRPMVQPAHLTPRKSTMNMQAVSQLGGSHQSIAEEQPGLRQRSLSLTPPDEGGTRVGSSVRSSSACPAEIAANTARRPTKGTRPGPLVPVSPPSAQRMHPATVQLGGDFDNMPNLASPMSTKAASPSPSRTRAMPMGLSVVGLDANALRAAAPVSPAKRETGHLPKVSDVRRQTERTVGVPHLPRVDRSPAPALSPAASRSMSPGAQRAFAGDSMRPRLSGTSRVHLTLL